MAGLDSGAREPAHGQDNDRMVGRLESYVWVPSQEEGASAATRQSCRPKAHDKTVLDGAADTEHSSYADSGSTVDSTSGYTDSTGEFVDLHDILPGDTISMNGSGSTNQQSVGSAPSKAFDAMTPLEKGEYLAGYWHSMCDKYIKDTTSPAYAAAGKLADQSGLLGRRMQRFVDRPRVSPPKLLQDPDDYNTQVREAEQRLKRLHEDADTQAMIVKANKLAIDAQKAKLQEVCDDVRRMYPMHHGMEKALRTTRAEIEHVDEERALLEKEIKHLELKKQAADQALRNNINSVLANLHTPCLVQLIQEATVELGNRARNQPHTSTSQTTITKQPIVPTPTTSGATRPCSSTMNVMPKEQTPKSTSMPAAPASASEPTEGGREALPHLSRLPLPKGGLIHHKVESPTSQAPLSAATPQSTESYGSTTATPGPGERHELGYSGTGAPEITPAPQRSSGLRKPTLADQR